MARGKYTVSTHRLVMPQLRSVRLVMLGILFTNPCAVSPAPNGPTQVNRYSAYVLIDGLKVRNAIQTATTSLKVSAKPLKRLNARRSYVDVRGCLQFSSRWFCGSFLLTWRRLCQTLLRPIVSACPISPAVREIVPYTSSLIHFSFTPLT
jgi:hypothetical protein